MKHAGTKIVKLSQIAGFCILILTGLIGSPISKWQEHFKGEIDEVRIYNRAISESEIQALYREDE